MISTIIKTPQRYSFRFVNTFVSSKTTKQTNSSIANGKFVVLSAGKVLLLFSVFAFELVHEAILCNWIRIVDTVYLGPEGMGPFVAGHSVL